MGLIKAIVGATGGVFADQWREYFYCQSLTTNTLAAKGVKRIREKRSSNTKGEENIISNGSILAVNDGQCMLIVEQGKIVEVCAEPGEFVWDSSTEPSIFVGKLGESIKNTFQTIGKRFTMGGDTGKDQRVYYINTKEIIGNKYGTASPVPFRVVDVNIGLDIDISIRCFGEYSYRIVDPLLFYTNVCGNVEQDYGRENIDSQLKTELLTALQPAFARISRLGVRYSALPGHTKEIADALNQELSAQWIGLRGIAVASFGVSSVSATEEDEAMIKELQRNAALRNPSMAAAHLTGAQAAAMQAAAKNEGSGAFMAFAGMNVANTVGGANATQLFHQAAAMQGTGDTEPASMIEGSILNQKEASTESVDAAWDCTCGAKGNRGNFCATCGAKRPNLGWQCQCGAVNQGNFCPNCGAKRPAGAPLYRCDKCGWQPEDPQHPPKFCPECGDPFTDSDKQ